jgi:hypothetical protein
VPEVGDHRGVDGGVEICVGEDKERGVPPCSMLTLTTRSAAWRRSAWPTAVEPVKESMRTRPSAGTASVTAFGSLVVSTPTAASGAPASTRISAMARAVSGVASAG